MHAVGTRVRVDERYLGSVVGHGHMGDTLLYIVEWDAGFWAWQANGGGSAAAVAGRNGSPDTFHSRSVVHPGACEAIHEDAFGPTGPTGYLGDTVGGAES